MATPSGPKRRKTDQSPPLSELPPMFRSAIQSLAEQSELVPAGTRISPATPAETVVAAIESRSVKELASYLRLVAMRLESRRDVLIPGGP